jgi:hypothetical protein
MTTMNRFRFEAELVRGEHEPNDIVRERAYGSVRVTADWPDDLTTPELRLSVVVQGDVNAIDAAAYVELFFHDLFLILNLASPGSFGGTLTITGGDLRATEVTLSARLFEFAGSLARLPLERVVAWYDSLHLGTQQVAGDAVSAALFELLHLARVAEDEEVSIFRLARAVERLLGRPASLKRLFTLRDDLAAGRTLVYHPMHYEPLDDRVEDATSEWIELSDAAAHAVIAELQRRVG